MTASVERPDFGFPVVSYLESAEGMTIRPRQVLVELRKRFIADDGIRDFFEHFGFRPEYDAQELLAWLGY